MPVEAVEINFTRRETDILELVKVYQSPGNLSRRFVAQADTSASLLTDGVCLGWARKSFAPSKKALP